MSEKSKLKDIREVKEQTTNDICAELSAKVEAINEKLERRFELIEKLTECEEASRSFPWVTIDRGGEGWMPWKSKYQVKGVLIKQVRREKVVEIHEQHAMVIKDGKLSLESDKTSKDIQCNNAEDVLKSFEEAKEATAGVTDYYDELLKLNKDIVYNSEAMVDDLKISLNSLISMYNDSILHGTEAEKSTARVMRTQLSEEVQRIDSRKRNKRLSRSVKPLMQISSLVLKATAIPSGGGTLIAAGILDSMADCYNVEVDPTEELRGAHVSILHKYLKHVRESMHDISLLREFRDLDLQGEEEADNPSAKSDAKEPTSPSSPKKPSKPTKPASPAAASEDDETVA